MQLPWLTTHHDQLLVNRPPPLLLTPLLAQLSRVSVRELAPELAVSVTDLVNKVPLVEPGLEPVGALATAGSVTVRLTLTAHRTVHMSNVPLVTKIVASSRSQKPTVKSFSSLQVVRISAPVSI